MGNLVIQETGNKYGKLIVIRRAGSVDGYATWVCRCDCGYVTRVKGANLRNGNTGSCGCRNKIAPDETGNKYGSLIVLSRGMNRGSGAAWICRCKCGTKIIVPASRLRHGGTNSCGCLQRLPKGQAAFNTMLRNVKNAAKARGYEWSLSNDFVRELNSQLCYYCGIAPKQRIAKIRTRKCNGDYIYNGIDRLNNTKGYTPDNVVPCCGTCNVAKHTMSESEFLDWIHRVYSYRMIRK